MDIKHVEIRYHEKAPFHAEICRIEKMAPHYHDTSLELLFCLEGEVNYVAGAQRGVITEGQVFSIDFEVIHYLYSDVPNTVLIFHLDLTGMNRPWEELQYFLLACESTHCYPYQISSMNKVKDLMLALSLEYFTGCSHPEESRATANALLELLIRHFNYYNYYNPDDYMDEELQERFYHILRYCFDHYTKKITLSDLAEAVHISKNYLSQYIRNTSFVSFTFMLKVLRCYKAERLLLTTRMSNAEIAFACGFSDSKYLYSAFESIWGYSPYSHRKSYRAYMRQQESSQKLSTEEAAAQVRNQIIDWHMNKNMLEENPGIAQTVIII